MDLPKILSRYVDTEDAKLLVATSTSDDGAVYLLDKKQALVYSTDFVPPMTDDPYLYGRIAAANALSDIYAMGASPLLALNICLFPCEGNHERIKEILHGGFDAVKEAGALLVGGHTMHDPEPKYGLAVIGITEPDKIWFNSRARVGDALILTKPIGTGAILSGYKRGLLPKKALDSACANMASLNKKAFEVAQNFSIHACTDITGFGLAGHAWEMARGSAVILKISLSAVPRYSAALAIFSQKIQTRLDESNRQYVSQLKIAKGIKPEEECLLFDPQTSGGLLLSLPKQEASSCLEALKKAGVSDSALIGEVLSGPSCVEVGV